MTVSISGTGRASQDISNANPQSFLITARELVAATAPFDAAGLKVSFVVRRKGQPVNVFNFDVRTLALANDPTKAESEVWTDGTFNYYGYEIVLPVPYNLDGDDSATISIDNRSNAGYSCQMTAVEGQGIEYYSPVIQIYDVDFARAQQNIDLPDFLSKITVVQEFSAASDPLTVIGLNFASELWNNQVNDVDIYGLLASQFPIGSAAAATASKSFMFYNGIPTFNCKLFLDVDTTASLETFVVAFGGVQDANIKARATARAARQKAVNSRIYG